MIGCLNPAPGYADLERLLSTDDNADEFSAMLAAIPAHVRRGVWPGPIWRRRINRLPLGGFTPDPQGEVVTVLPMQSAGEGSAVLDVVAVADDGAVMTYWGGYALIGWHHFDEAEIRGVPLRLHRDPVAWAAAGGVGCAIVDQGLAAPLLRNLAGIICDQADHADAVRRILLPWGRCPPLFLSRRKAA